MPDAAPRAERQDIDDLYFQAMGYFTAKPEDIEVTPVGTNLQQSIKVPPLNGKYYILHRIMVRDPDDLTKVADFPFLELVDAEGKSIAATDVTIDVYDAASDEKAGEINVINSGKDGKGKEVPGRAHDLNKVRDDVDDITIEALTLKEILAHLEWAITH